MPFSDSSGGQCPQPIGALRAEFDDSRRIAGLDAAGAVLVCCFDLNEWKPWLAEAEALLDEAERVRVQRRQRPSDREHLALTYALHRLALSEALLRDPQDIALMRDALGRPCLRSEELQTSLTHTEGFAAIAISRQGRVGVDMEPMSRAPDMIEIAERVCHPNEANALSHLSEYEYAQALLALWVRKEAVLKMAGIGLAEEMAEFEAPPDQAILLPGGRPEQAVVRMGEIGAAWVCAVATSTGVDIASAWFHPRARG